MDDFLLGKKSKEKSPVKEERFEIQVKLFKPGTKSYPKFDFRKECKKQLGSKAKSLYDFEGTNGISYSTELAIIKRLEKKYGKKRVKNKVIAGISDRVLDKGAGYDKDDDFIDDTEEYDEQVPSSKDTLHGGYYVNKGKLEWKARDVLEVSEDDDSDSGEEGELSEGEEIDDDEVRQLNEGTGDIELSKRKAHKTTAEQESAGRNADGPTTSIASAQRIDDDGDIQLYEPHKQQTQPKDASLTPGQKRPASDNVVGSSNANENRQEPIRRMTGAPPRKKFAPSGNQKVATELKRKALKKSQTQQPTPAKSSTPHFTSASLSQPEAVSSILARLGALPAINAIAAEQQQGTSSSAGLLQSPPKQRTVTEAAQLLKDLISSPSSVSSQINSSIGKKQKDIPALSSKLSQMIRDFIMTTEKMGEKKKLAPGHIDMVIAILDQATRDGFSTHERSRLLNKVSGYCGYQRNTLYLKVQARRESIDAQRQQSSAITEQTPSGQSAAGSQLPARPSTQTIVPAARDDDIQFVGVKNAGAKPVVSSKPSVPKPIAAKLPAPSSNKPSASQQQQPSINAIDVNSISQDLISKIPSAWTHAQKQESVRLLAIASQHNIMCVLRVLEDMGKHRNIAYDEFAALVAKYTTTFPQSSVMSQQQVKNLTTGSAAPGPSKVAGSQVVKTASATQSASSSSTSLSPALAANSNALLLEIQKEINDIEARDNTEHQRKLDIFRAVGGMEPKREEFRISDKLSELLRVYANNYWKQIKANYTDECKRLETFANSIKLVLYTKFKNHFTASRLIVEMYARVDELIPVLDRPELRAVAKRDKIDVAGIIRSCQKPGSSTGSVKRPVQQANKQNVVPRPAMAQQPVSAAQHTTTSVTRPSAPASSSAVSRPPANKTPTTSPVNASPRNVAPSTSSSDVISQQQLKQAQDAMLQLIANTMMNQQQSTNTVASPNKEQIELMKKLQEEALRLQAADRAKIQAAKEAEEKKKRELEEKKRKEMEEKRLQKEREKEAALEEARKKKEAERLEKLRLKEEERLRKEKEKQEKLEAERTRKEEAEKQAALEKARIEEEARKKKEQEEERLRIARIKQAEQEAKQLQERLQEEEQAATQQLEESNLLDEFEAFLVQHERPPAAEKEREEIAEDAMRSSVQGNIGNQIQQNSTVHYHSSQTTLSQAGSARQPANDMQRIAPKTEPTQAVPAIPISQQNYQQNQQHGNNWASQNTPSKSSISSSPQNNSNVPGSPLFNLQQQQNMNRGGGNSMGSPVIMQHNSPLFNGQASQFFQSSPQGMQTPHTPPSNRHFSNQSPANQFTNHAQQNAQTQHQNFPLNRQQNNHPQMNQMHASSHFQNQGHPLSPEFQHQNSIGQMSEMSPQMTRQTVQNTSPQRTQIHQTQPQTMMQHTSFNQQHQQNQQFQQQQYQQQQQQQLMLNRQAQVQREQAIRAQQEQEHLQQIQQQQRINLMQQHQFAQPMQPNNMGIRNQQQPQQSFGGMFGGQQLQHRPNMNNMNNMGNQHNQRPF